MKIIVFILICFISSHSINLLRTINDNEMVISINQMNTTWTAGHNKRFDNMIMSDVFTHLGALYTPEEKKLKKKMLK